MSSPEQQRNPVERLAEEFVARYRQGERPSATEYAQRYPELAAEIREVFPALLLLEEAGPAPAATEPASPPAAAAPVRLGDFRILREVGRGGMGVVYEAVQESLGRHVALKVLPANDAEGPTRLERFRREARSAARLHHSNIVPVFEVGECGGTYYYAMQFIRGQGLDSVLDELRHLRDGPPSAGGAAYPKQTAGLAEGLRTGRFAPAGTGEGEPPSREGRPGRAGEVAPSGAVGPTGSLSATSAPGGSPYYRSVARLGLQAAEALAYAHGQGVLHRDVKPANLLLDAEGSVWLTDFGLAKEEGGDALTRTGDVVGTLRYMPPERFSGVSDARGDVYSLGATLYELLTLRPAFDETDRGRLVRQVTQEEPPRPRRLDRRVPRDLETVVLKAAAKEPQRRYQSADALAEDLRRFLADRPVLARRTSALEHAWRWCRRNPALGGAALLAVAGALATVALAVWFALYQADANDELRRRQQATEAALFQSRLGAARLAQEHGLALLRQGETNPGLIWLAHALEIAPEGAADWRANVCRQLAWCRGQATPLRQALAHPAEVTALAFSPDGQTVFTGCADGKARHWDARSGKLLGEPAALTKPVDRLVPSADGKTLCALNKQDKQERRFFDATSGKPLPGPRGAFPPWDWLTGPLVHCSTDGKTVVKIQRVYLPNVPYFAVGTLTAEDAPGKKRTLGLGMILYPSFFLSPDGKLFLYLSEVRSTATKAPVGKALRNAPSFTVAAFRPDGKGLLTCDSYHTVQAWDVQTGERVGPPLTHSASVTALAYSPDGRLALTACADGGARLWDLTPGLDFRDVEVLALKQTKGPEQPQLILHDGRCTAVDRAKRVYRHDGARAHYLWTLPLTGALDRVAVAPGGQVLATASRDQRNRWDRPAKVQFWNANTGQQVGRALVHPGPVSTLAFSPDGETVATAGTDGNVRFWKVGTDAPAGATLSHPKGPTIHIAFSPDGSRVFTGCADKVRLWDRATGELLHTFPHPGGGIGAVAVAQGGLRLLVAGQATARLWDVATKKPVGPSMTHSSNVYAVAFSPDGQVALTGGFTFVQLWEASTALPLGAPLPCPQSARALAFTPDREAILVGHDLGYRLFRIKRPVPDDARRLALSAQVLTGLELDEGGAVQVLDAAAWNDRRRRLEEAGGSLLP
jgi:WD40 repeat protein/serine/threonine protein kinase